MLWNIKICYQKDNNIILRFCATELIICSAPWVRLPGAKEADLHGGGEVVGHGAGAKAGRVAEGDRAGVKVRLITPKVSKEVAVVEVSDFW